LTWSIVIAFPGVAPGTAAGAVDAVVVVEPVAAVVPGADFFPKIADAILPKMLMLASWLVLLVPVPQPRAPDNGYST
jgi:hypothetical protein